MNRCILCTRCVRFFIEVIGKALLNVYGRGSRIEISMYVNDFANEELSANIVPICPVASMYVNDFANYAKIVPKLCPVAERKRATFRYRLGILFKERVQIFFVYLNGGLLFQQDVLFSVSVNEFSNKVYTFLYILKALRMYGLVMA